MKRIKAFTPVTSRWNVSETAWAYLMIAALLTPSFIWTSRDHSVWPWDQAWYGEVSVDLWFWLGHSLVRWWGEMIKGLYLKPPGIVWLGQFFVPFRGMFGSVEAALLFSILLTQFVVLVLLFKIGRRMAPQSRLIPVVGVLFASWFSAVCRLVPSILCRTITDASCGVVLLHRIEGHRLA